MPEPPICKREEMLGKQWDEKGSLSLLCATYRRIG